MEYMSARQTAEKWDVSVRLVQQYCAEGRIQGAKKTGIAWEVPMNAEKPADPRKHRSSQGDCLDCLKEPSISNLMPLMNTAFYPGKCLNYLQSMKAGSQKSIAFAEYYYFRGEARQAVDMAENYLDSKDTAIRLSASLIYVYASISIDQVDQARHVLASVQKFIAEIKQDESSLLHAASMFISVAASVLLHFPLSEEWKHAQDLQRSLPVGIRAFALYLQAHSLYLQGEYNQCTGIVEATLTMGGGRFPIPAIYLHLAGVMGYMGLKQTQRAREHLLAAWEIGKPDGLIEPFGEHHGLLGGMLEVAIKPVWPLEFKRMTEITYRFSKGWRIIHNAETGNDVADELTTTEFAIAMLAARKWTNQEIGDHMNISVNTIKHHLSQIMKKLHVKNRKELINYMLK